MGPFYTKQEEQDKQFLAKAREVLFRNKHKFFHLPQWTTPELRRRIARIVEQRAPEPEFLKRTTTLSHEEILHWCKRRAARLDRYYLAITNQRGHALTDQIPREYHRHLSAALARCGTEQEIETLCSQIETVQKNSLKIPLNAGIDERLAISKQLAKNARGEIRKAAADTPEGSADAAILFARNALGAAWGGPGSKWTPQGTIARLTDHHFWYRRLRNIQNDSLVHAGRVLQMMGDGPGRVTYLPRTLFANIRQQDQKNQDWMKTTAITNGKKTLILAEVTKDSIQKRINKQRVINKGRHIINTRNGLELRVLTITFPSRFHSVAMVGKGKKHAIPNSNYDPSLTIRDGLKWYQNHWKELRARLASKGLRFGIGRNIDFYFVCEPHRDATPHFHGLLWLRPDDEEFVKQVMFQEFVYGDMEPGALEHRIKWEIPRDSLKTANQYINKSLEYLLKTQTANCGETEEDQEKGREASVTRAVHTRRIRSSNAGQGLLDECRKPEARHNTQGRSPDAETREILTGLLASRGDQATHKTAPEHFVKFFDGVGNKKWLKCNVDSDMYDIEYKTPRDFLEETEGDVEAAIEIYETLSWIAGGGSCMGYLGDPTDEEAREASERLIKKKERKLNAMGEPLSVKPTSLVYLPLGGGAEIIELSREKWTVDELETQQLRAEAEAARQANEFLAKAKLHLFKASQGGACGPAKPPETRVLSNYLLACDDMDQAIQNQNGSGDEPLWWMQGKKPEARREPCTV